MKILIDECIDERLRLHFSADDCQTVSFAGFAGLKNGRLLDAADAAGFQVLITVDQHSTPTKSDRAGNGDYHFIRANQPPNRLGEAVASSSRQTFLN